MQKVNLVVRDHFNTLWSPNMEVEKTEETKQLNLILEPEVFAVEKGETIKDKIGFIGSGNMCKALAGGLINKKTADKE